MSTQTVIIMVYVAGLLAMVAEMFLPGAVIGLCGLLAAAGSTVFAFTSGYPVTGAVQAVLLLAFVPLFFYVWKNVIARWMAHSETEEGFRLSEQTTEALLGLEGTAVTALHPGGIAKIDGRRRDVVTRGEMLESGTRIKVIEVSGNRVVVREVR